MTPDPVTDNAVCEHYWFAMRGDEPYTADSFVKEVCGKPASSHVEWLGSHGKPDQEIAVCDSCRKMVEVQNTLQRAERDGTLEEMLFGYPIESTNAAIHPDSPPTPSD